ncbi:MAG: hypothetical protein ABIO45_14990 [Burkholderiaceae bacterium]
MNVRHILADTMCRCQPVRCALLAVALLQPLISTRAGEPVLAPAESLPRTLRETGLYGPGGGRELAPGIVPFSPQYPLWSDGADKRRWLSMPEGAFIDARNPDEWEFPPGIRLWKEFAHDGRRVETRYIARRGDGSWQFAAYVWNADGSDAVLAPDRGIAALPALGAPGGRYAIPSRNDCLACHGSGAVPVLGVSALQLSPDRDPLAPHIAPGGTDEIDLRALVTRGWLRNLPPLVLERAPRVAGSSPVERAALGYLHANCGNCHNASAARVPVRLNLAQSVADPGGSRAAALRTTVQAASRYQPPGPQEYPSVVAAGHAEASVLALRMASRDPQVQMPPLGTRIPDVQGLALVRRWIDHHLSQPKEPPP